MSISVLAPSSINKKRSAFLPGVTDEMSEHQKKVIRNRRRGLRIATNARANKELYNEVSNYIDRTDLDNSEIKYFVNLRRALQTCCQHSLYRQYEHGDSLEYIASQTCKHKLCCVCNAERAKALRRKYLSYFRRSQMVDKKSGEVSKSQDFDYMHLTLTVPHTNQGWNGKQWYATELMSAFNRMRKMPWWETYVWGGEFGLEVTKNESGLHIHIHSLLIVRRIESSRNTLQRLILMAWNGLTENKQANRTSFSDAEIEAIKKGCKSLTDEDISKLKPNGATLIGLESLFVYKSKKVSNRDRWNAEKGKWKHYINPSDENDFMSGVLECLKYHFEPVSFDKETGVYQFDLLREILPNIFRKPLYRKFGNLHGVAELNINDKSATAEELNEAIEELGDVPTNPETGQEDSAYNYVVVSAKNVFYDFQNNLKPKIAERARALHLRTDSIYSAVQVMINMSVSARKPRESITNKGTPALSDIHVSDNTDNYDVFINHS